MSEGKSLELYSKFDENPQLCLDKLLTEASTKGDIDMVIDLLQKGADTNAAEYLKHHIFSGQDYRTPVTGACLSGNVKLLRVLLENGADPNATDSNTMTPLHYAAQKGNRDCLRLLIEYEANVNASTQHYNRPNSIPRTVPGGSTALHLAASTDHSDIMEDLILLGGADYNQMNRNGLTCLNIASNSGNEQRVLKLFKCAIGRELIAYPDPKTGDTPLHDCVRLKMKQAVRELLMRGSDVNFTNKAELSPFHMAVNYCGTYSYDILESIVTKGINLDINTKRPVPHSISGWIGVLHMVTFCDADVPFISRRPEAAVLLVRYGADCNIWYKSLSLLQHELYCAETEDLLETIIRASMYIDLSHCKVENLTLYAYPRGCRRIPQSILDKRIERLRLLNSNPRRLLHCCRFTIRKYIGSKRMNKIPTLEIPDTLKDYLLLKY